jgi:flagella basal body P-ring formation protein FlgA
MTNLAPYNHQRQGLATLLMQPKWLALAALLWLITTATQAAQWQAHKDIYQAVNEFSQQQLGGQASTTKLDERSRYPLCKTPLQVTLPFNNHKTVKVICQQSHSSSKPSWSLYLSINVHTNTKAWRVVSPIAGQSTINASQVALVTYNGTRSDFIGTETNPIGQQVTRHLNVGHWLSHINFSELQLLWRAAKDIPQGHVITSTHLTTSKESTATSSPNAITNQKQLLGKLAKRYIRAGKLLDKNDIEGQQHVVVSSQALDLGRELINQDLTMAWVPDHKLRQAGFNHKEALVGWVTKRHIASGTPLTQDMLRQSYLVIKGSMVTLQITLNNYQITNQAQALSNGNLGDKIDVKVTPSGLIKSGLVIAKGQVELSR